MWQSLHCVYVHTLIHSSSLASIEFFDELSKTESSVDGESEPAAQPLPDFSVKVLQLSGLMLEVGSTQLEPVRLDQSIDGE